MTKRMAAAADHGLNHFIFDWYWYDDQPYLNRPLADGFLRAPNNDRLRFALMWANHDWLDIQPAKRNGEHKLLFPGSVTREVFEHIMDHVIEKYFKHPSYWKIDGKPYFSIYELFRFVSGLGGVDAARAALDDFRRKTRAAGFPDLHLNAVVWGVQILPNETTLKNPNEMLARLGFDSVTSYVWVHHIKMPNFPETDYLWTLAEAEKHWRKTRAEFTLPYQPNVSMGWDSSPRTIQSDVYAECGYPYTATLKNNTPANFERALQRMKVYLDEQPTGPRIGNINAWNEWTEGSYLEPDTVNGFGYLEAIKKVFVS